MSSDSIDSPEGSGNPLKWTPLHEAVATGTLEELESVVKAGVDLEAVDIWKRTAFLLSVDEGSIEKAAFLLSQGANRDARGHCEMPMTHYPIRNDDAGMLQWLIRQGVELNLKDEFGDTALRNAVEGGALECFRVLMEAGADWRATDCYGDPLIRKANHQEIISTLIALGQDAGKLEAEPLRDWIGLGNLDHLPVSKEEFVHDRTRRFGKANPERMDVPFWRGMVRCGWGGYQAACYFEETFDENNPVWCHERFGMSLTQLDDGGFVQIAGEHEDYYDADFCIYNDVIVHDGKGGFEILGYPEDVFPPTDFHSATLVKPWIYIIGNLGDLKTQQLHDLGMPVYRLHVETFRIERVFTHGASPGWIHKHEAVFQDGRIILSGGDILTRDADGKAHIQSNPSAYALDLATMTWQQLADPEEIG